MGAIPAVVLATFLLAAVKVPLLVGLQIAKPAMVSFAENPDAPEPARVGPYSVGSAEHLDDGGARFLFWDGGFLSSNGFVYFPDGSPPQTDPDRHYEDEQYVHLYGPWYTYSKGAF